MVLKDSEVRLLLILVAEDRAECAPWPAPVAPAADEEEFDHD